MFKEDNYKIKKKFNVDLAIYGSTIDFFIGVDSTNKLFKELKKKKYFKSEDSEKYFQEVFEEFQDALGITCFHKEKIVVIINKSIEPKDNLYEFINTLTHEITHVTNILLASRGVEFTGGADEAFAYLSGFINQEAFKKIFEVKLKETKD